MAGLSLRNITKKIGDFAGGVERTVNPFDNGRSYSQLTPTNNYSVFGQAIHANPVMGLANRALIHPIGSALENTASHIPTFSASSPARFLNNSVINPIKLTDMHVGKAIQGRNPYHGSVKQQFGQAGQDAINMASVLPLGKVGSIAMKGAPLVSKVATGAKFGAKAGAGFGTAQGASTSLQNNLNLPQALKTTGTGALMGAGLGTALGVAAPLAGAKLGAKAPKVPDVHGVSVVDKSSPASVTKYIAVKQTNTPSPTELVNRYNSHMANLSKKYGLNQKQVTLAGKPGRQGIISEPSVYNDVGYQAEKQQIQNAYQNGTLSKPIPVGEAKPVATIKAPKVVTSKDEATLAKLSAQKNLGKQGQIKEALLKEKLGVAPEVAAPTAPLAPTSDVSGLDVAARSTSGVLNKIYKPIAEGIYQRREIGETLAAVAKNRLKVTNSLSDKEQTNLARVLGGTEQPLNNKVSQAVQESRAELNRIHDLAVKNGVPVPGKRANYFPHIHDPANFKEGSKGFKGAVKHLVDTGQAKDEATAIGYLRTYRNTTSMSPYRNLSERRQLNLPGYAENRVALHHYIDRAYATIAHHNVFGAKDEKLNKMFEDIKTQGGNVEQAIKSYTQASGLTRGSDIAERASKIATNFQGATKLGLSSVGNFTQKVNNAIAGGVGREAKAIVGQFSKKNKEFIANTGVKDEQVAHEALFGEQGISPNLRGVTAPLFERVEKSNRAEGAIVGRDQANALAKKAAKGDANAAAKLKEDFGITNYSKGGLSQADQIRAGRRFVERTQFRTGPQDLPGWTTTPGGRVVSQFRRYPYKQAEFLKKEVLDKVRHGDPMPLVRLATVGAPLGIASQATVGAIRGNNFQQSGPEKVINAINDATGASLATSLPQSLYPSSKDANSYTAKVVKGLGGPTVGDAVKTVQAGFDASKGKATNAARLGLSHVPVVGTPLSNRLMPYPGGKTAPAKPGEPQTLDQLNATAKQETKDFKTNMKPGDDRLAKLSNGKFIYQVGNEVKTTDSLQKAREGLAKHSFERSGAPSKTVNGKYYYRDENNAVKSMPKYKHEFDLADSQNQLDMTVAKDGGDYGGWAKAAQRQVKALETLRDKYNKDSQPDKVDDVNKKIATLKNTIGKYVAYGGSFTKPKKGGSGSGFGSRGGSVGSSRQYAISLSAGNAAAPHLTIKRPGSGGGRKVTAKKFSSPKVTIKKSKV